MSLNLSNSSSAEPATTLPQASVDLQALLKNNAFHGYQIASLAVPPLYLAMTLARRRPLSFNKVLVATMLGGAVGAAAGVGVGTLQYGNEAEDRLVVARRKITYDTNQIRLGDYATLGGLLGAVLTPALLYRRTRLVFAIFGGAGIGVGAGTGVHYWRNFQDRQLARQQGISVPPTSPHTNI